MNEVFVIESDYCNYHYHCTDRGVLLLSRSLTTGNYLFKIIAKISKNSQGATYYCIGKNSTEAKKRLHNILPFMHIQSSELCDDTVVDDVLSSPTKYIVI